MNARHTADITTLTFGSLDALPGPVHAFSTRAGGVSRSPFDSLNLGFWVGDAPEAVVENRRRFAMAVGFDPAHVVATRQVHGTVVRTVGRADRGAGALAAAPEDRACDALVTRERDVILMGLSADCPLVLLADVAAGVVALAHAGWRSAFGGILLKTVDAMREAGADSRRVRAGIGAAIGPCCYEVGAELRPLAAEALPDADRFFLPRGGKFLLDLPGLCAQMLIQAGIREGHIENAGLCTRCGADRFFSYRAAGGKTGRIAAVIGLKTQEDRHSCLSKGG